MNVLSETMTKPSGELHAALLVTLSAILYGFLGYFGASLLNLHFSISTMLFWRFAIAAVWMLLSMTLRKERLLYLSSVDKFHILFLVLSSICYSIACTFYFMASKLTGTGIAMVIYFAYPMFVVLMVMMKEKKLIDKNTFFSLCLIILGLFFLKGSTEHHLVSKYGVFFALTSAFFFAGYVYCSKFISHTFSSHFLTFIVCFSNAAYFLVYSLLSHSFYLPDSSKMWFFICALGVIATALPIQLMLQGLKILSASKASILSALEPTVTLFVGMLLLNEYVSGLQMIGAMFILFSAVYIQFSNQNSS